MYHPNLPKLEWTIRHYHHILQDSDQLWQAFPSLPIIAFRRLRNLRDLLVRADFTPKRSDTLGNFCSKAIRCKTCPILVTTDTFSSSVTGEHFKLKLRVSQQNSKLCSRGERFHNNSLLCQFREDVMIYSGRGTYSRATPRLLNACVTGCGKLASNQEWVSRSSTIVILIAGGVVSSMWEKPGKPSILESTAIVSTLPIVA